MISLNVSRAAGTMTLAALFASVALTAHADEKMLNATLRQSGGIHAAADPAFYDNTSTFTGSGYTNKGATTASKITTLVADDITLAGSQAVSITGFSFSVANFGATTASARARVRFYLGDGTGGLPGTELQAFSFNPIAFGGNSVNVYSTTIIGSEFVVPANSLFWAGITFDNVGATATTVAQLNNLGQGLYNPPTIGSSQDVAFQTATPGSFNQNNPPGALFFLGGTPPTNFGWTFNGNAIPAATPEPGTVAMLTGFGVSGLALLRRRKIARK